MMIRTALGVTAAMAVLISCAQSPGSTATGSPATTAPTTKTSTPATAAATPTPGASFAVSHEIDARATATPVDQKFWDRDLILDTTQKPLPKNAAVHDLTDRGGLLISQADTVVKDGNPILRPAKVSIWSPNGKLQLLDDATGRPKPVRQPANGQMHGGDATWFNTTSTDLFQQDWRIRFYDARTRTTRLIADSDAVFPGVKELRPSPYDTIPVLSDDKTIYWAAAAPDKNAYLGYTAVIMARDSATRGPVKTIARNASLPTIVGKTLYYARLDDVSPETPQKRLEIRAVTPGGEDHVVVAAPLVKDQQILHLAATATHLAWVISDTDRQANPTPDPNEGCTDTKYHGCSLYVMKLGTNQATRIQLHTYSATPELTSTLLGWGGSSSSGDTGEYVMDLASNKTWRVGAARGCSEVLFAGAYASWSTADQAGQCSGRMIVRWRTPQ